MNLFFQQILNGLTLGSVYGLVALGLTLVYGILHVPNFSHGALYMVGAYASLTLMTSLGLNYWVAMLGAGVVVAILSVLSERLVFHPLRDAPPIHDKIAAIGILPARNTDVLGAMDAVATEIFLPVGGLLISILVGWRMSDRIAAFTEGAGPGALAFMGMWRWFLRIIVPPILLLVLYTTIPKGYAAVMAIFQAS